MSDHVHQLVLVGSIEGEYGGSYPCRHCRLCGTLVLFTLGNTYEMIPEMVRGQVTGAKREMVAHKMPRQRPSKQALGRGLIELMASAKSPVKFPGT